MSQLNNRNSNPTIPPISSNRFNSINHPSTNYTGSLVNNIHFRDEKIKYTIANLTAFINTLLTYISKVCNVLRNEFNKYMDDLTVEDSSIGSLIEFRKADSTYKQTIKILENFSSDIAHDYSKVLQWAMELDACKIKYSELINEYNEFKANAYMYQDYDYEVDFDRGSRRQNYWKRYSDLGTKKNTMNQQYNEIYSNYNQFIAKISILKNSISDGRILYTPILKNNREYSISLKDFIDEFGKLVTVTDASSNKRGQVISKLITDYMRQLGRTVGNVDVNRILELENIDN